MTKNKVTTMLLKIFQAIPRRVRLFVGARYRPERHYMRGFGPASAARRQIQH